MPLDFPPTFIARCQGFDKSEEEFHFLWQEQQFSAKANQNLKITDGALVLIQSSQGKFIPEKVLYTPLEGLKANGDALRWRKLNQSPSLRFTSKLRSRNNVGDQAYSPR